MISCLSLNNYNYNFILNDCPRGSMYWRNILKIHKTNSEMRVLMKPEYLYFFFFWSFLGVGQSDK